MWFENFGYHWNLQSNIAPSTKILLYLKGAKLIYNLPSNSGWWLSNKRNFESDNLILSEDNTLVVILGNLKPRCSYKKNISIYFLNGEILLIFLLQYEELTGIVPFVATHLKVRLIVLFTSAFLLFLALQGQLPSPVGQSPNSI